MDDDEDSWPQTFPDLKRLDDLLKCGICYEYVKTALITPCSHNFCSLCIRKFMQYKAYCPACFIETNDNKLRNNKVLDELVTLIKRLKKPLTNALQVNQTEKTSIDIPLDKSSIDCLVEKTSIDIPKETKVTSIPNTTDVFVNKTENRSESRNFLSPSPSYRSESPNDLPPSPSYEPESLNDLPPSPSYAPESPIYIIEEIPSNNEKPSIKTQFEKLMSPRKFQPSSPKSIKPQASSSTSSPKINSFFNNSKITMVNCPVCSTEIPQKNINIHLDTCLKTPDSTFMPRINVNKCNTSKTRRTPLAKVVYRLMSDKELKKKLTEYKLSTSGDRKTLEKRHQRFVLIYNSETDKENPREISEIVKQVDKEEKDEIRSNCKTWTSLQVDRKADPKVIEDVHKKYREENKSSFNNLIADLKRRQQEKKNKTISLNNTDIPIASTSQENKPVIKLRNIKELQNDSELDNSTSLLENKTIICESPPRTPTPPRINNVTEANSPIIGQRKNLIVLSSDDEDDDNTSVSTVFSAGDLAEIDLMMSQSMVQLDNEGNIGKATSSTSEKNSPRTPEQNSESLPLVAQLLEQNSENSDDLFEIPNITKSPIIKNRSRRKRIIDEPIEPTRRSTRKRTKC